MIRATSNLAVAESKGDMLRTWEELQAYLMAQGLVDADGVTEADNVDVTPEGIQVAVVLLSVMESMPVGNPALIRAAQASIAINPHAHHACRAIFPPADAG